MEDNREFVTLHIPFDCRRYPWDGGEIDREMPFQKVSFVKDAVHYVAVEAKIYKYNHVLYFARYVLCLGSHLTGID